MMLVDTPQQLAAVVERYLQRGTPIFADTETTGLNPRVNKLVMVQLWQGVPGTAPVIIDWRRLTEDGCLDADLARRELDRLSGLRWVFHNAKFDWKFLAMQGIELRNLYDSMIAEQVILSASERPHLVDVVEKYAGVTLDKEARGWFFSPAPLDERPEWYQPFPTEELEYGAKDVLYLPQVCAGQANALRASGQVRIFNIEMRAIPAIARMEMNGVNINVDEWRSIIQEQEAEGQRLYQELLTSDLAQAIMRVRARELDAQVEAREVWELERDTFLFELREKWDATHTKKEAGWGLFKKNFLADWKAQNPAPPTPNKALRDINIGSSQQLKAGLEELGIRLRDTTAKSLTQAADRFPVLLPLLAWRRCEKLVSTYGESLLAQMGEDGRMHPTFHQIGAVTGRMASADPNWQNIPARSEVGKRLRLCVQAPAGRALLVGDFKNIELCILADQSGDERMMEMFASGEDLHSFTAKLMFKLPADLTNEEVKAYRLPNGLKARDMAKAVNFGVAYGQTAKGFARTNNVSVAEAEQFMEAYFTMYKQAGEYLKARADAATRLGYSTTPLGRRLYFNLPEAPEPYAKKDEFWQYDYELEVIRRAAMNHPMQGGNADITKIALANFDDLISGYGYDAKLVAAVHDELVVETGALGAENMKELLEDCMWDAAKSVLKRVSVPRPDVHVGTAWEHD